jgi:hypothetical protein
MDEQIAQQLGIGVGCLLIGLSGWLLPFRWNLLRLRRRWASMISEETNKNIPKIVGSILILLGIVLLIATAVVGKFE